MIRFIEFPVITRSGSLANKVLINIGNIVSITPHYEEPNQTVLVVLGTEDDYFTIGKSYRDVLDIIADNT